MSDSASIITIALKAITDRSTILLALSMAFALFCWSMWAGTTLSLCVAGAFAGFVFLPVLWKGASSGSKDD